MNALNKGRREVKKSIDAVWTENLNKLEGPLGTDILVNDNPDIISRIIKAVKDKDRLPDDLGDPEYEDEAEGVNDYAQTLYDLFSEGAQTAGDMMVGEKVERAYEDIMDEIGKTRDMYDETGHSRGDF